MSKQAPDLAELFDEKVAEARSLCECDRDFRGASVILSNLALRLRQEADELDFIDRSPE